MVLILVCVSSEGTEMLTWPLLCSELLTDAPYKDQPSLSRSAEELSPVRFLFALHESVMIDCYYQCNYCSSRGTKNCI